MRDSDSIVECLRLLRDVKKRIPSQSEYWSEVEEEIDHLISSLESKFLRSSESYNDDDDMKKLLERVIWWITAFFGLSDK